MRSIHLFKKMPIGVWIRLVQDVYRFFFCSSMWTLVFKQALGRPKAHSHRRRSNIVLNYNPLFNSESMATTRGVKGIDNISSIYSQMSISSSSVTWYYSVHCWITDEVLATESRRYSLKMGTQEMLFSNSV